MSKPTKEKTPPRLRLTSTIDLSKAKPGCNRCHGNGVVGYKTIPEQKEKVPVICRCVTRRGGVKEDALDRIAKQMFDQLETGQFGKPLAADIMGLP